MYSNHFNWANWLLVKCMTREQGVVYANYAAELVLYIFEDKHPKDKRPRNATVATKKYITNPSVTNKRDVSNAASDAYLAYTAYSDFDTIENAAAYAAFSAYAAASSTSISSSAFGSASASASAYVAYQKTTHVIDDIMYKIIDKGLEIVDIKKKDCQHLSQQEKV